MNIESSRDEIENIGKIIQRNLATRIVGFDDPNFLAKAIRDEENIWVIDKCTLFGFKSFKEFLESPEMSKFVDVILCKDGGTVKTIYKAKRDATTRNVMEQQKWFYEKEGRLKEQRRQHFQLINDAAAKKRCSMVPLASIQPSSFQMKSSKPVKIGNNVAAHSDSDKWKLDIPPTTKIDDSKNVVIVPPNPKNLSVANPPAPISSSPASPAKKQASVCKMSSNPDWKRLELPFGKDPVLRRNGICAEYPEYNVDIVTDPRPRHQRIHSSIVEELQIPHFYAHFFSAKKSLRSIKKDRKMCDDDEEEEDWQKENEEDDGENCQLINVRAVDDKNNGSSDDETFGFKPVSAVTSAGDGGSNSADNLTEEKMRHLGAIATSFCRYKFKFCGSTPVKFDHLRKVLSNCEPLFNNLMKNSQMLVDFFTLFCSKLQLIYAPPKHELDQFHLYFNGTNE